MASAIAAASGLLRVVARIRYRLLLVNLIVAAVPVAGITFAEMHERQLLAALERDMIHQAQPPRRRAAGLLAVHESAAARAATRTRIRLSRPARDADRTAAAPEGAEKPVPAYFDAPSQARGAKPLALAEREVKRRSPCYRSATRLWRRARACCAADRGGAPSRR
jgi:two-component system sensor histidine kinase ChvG